MSWRTAKYIWLACMAGWLGVYLVTQLPAAMTVMILCAVAAGLCTIMEDAP